MLRVGRLRTVAVVVSGRCAVAGSEGKWVIVSLSLKASQVREDETEDSTALELKSIALLLPRRNEIVYCLVSNRDVAVTTVHRRGRLNCGHRLSVI